MGDGKERDNPEISKVIRKSSGERLRRHRMGRKFTLRPCSIAHIKNSRELEVSGTVFCVCLFFLFSAQASILA